MEYHIDFMHVESSLNPWNKSHLIMVLSSVQLLSRVWLSGTPWTTGRQASLSITNF